MAVRLWNARQFFVTFVPLVFLRVQVVFRRSCSSRRIQGIRKSFHRQGAKTANNSLPSRLFSVVPVPSVSPW